MVVLLLVGAGCSSAPSTRVETSRQAGPITTDEMVGEWKGVEGTGAAKIVFNADGSYVSYFDDGEQYSSGTWRVESGALTMEAADYVGGAQMATTSFDGKTLQGYDAPIELDQVWEKQ